MKPIALNDLENVRGGFLGALLGAAGPILQGVSGIVAASKGGGGGGGGQQQAAAAPPAQAAPAGAAAAPSGGSPGAGAAPDAGIGVNMRWNGAAYDISINV